MDNSSIQKSSDTNFNSFQSKNYFFYKLLFGILGFIFFIFFLYFIFFSSPLNFPKGFVVNIRQGESLRSLSYDLKDKNIIRSRIAFEAFVISYGGEKHIAVGDYLFENKLSVFEVARRIVERDRQLASIKITIPEGFNILEIADIASLKLKNFNKEIFLLKAKEGYLFPDTYFFFSSDNEEDVLKYMSNNFTRKMKIIEKDIVLSGKTESEILIMASIIEREAKGDMDRGYISGILWNRIAKNMPLQVDAAPNTYKEKGLPENPICNPGLEAINASIKPTLSNYLYYLHDKNGGIHYAKNFEEHKKNKLKYLE